MNTLIRAQPCSVSQKLIELLEEARGLGPATRAPGFGDRLDALEVEALERGAPSATLVMIRVAREAVEFAERIAFRSQPMPTLCTARVMPPRPAAPVSQL